MTEYVKKQDVWDMLHRMGGCDATNDYDKGWDEAITTAVCGLEDLAVTIVSIRKGYEEKGASYERT